MRKIKFIPLFIGLLLSLQLLSSETITVNNTLDLLNAIDSDKTIIIEEVKYNISEVIFEVTNPIVSLIDEFDGPSPHYTGVNNLKIVGKGKVEIVIEPRYSWVLSFSNSTNLVFDNLILGHTEAGYCTGGVMAFEGCEDILIDGCSLYGSGTVGIYAQSCSRLAVKKSDIYECTYGLLYLYDSKDITFEKTSFRKTVEFDLIEIMNCQNVNFNKCEFTENYNGDFMPFFFRVDEDVWNGGYKEQSSSLVISKCKFTNNEVYEFCNHVEVLDLKKNKFSENKFSTPEQ
ncbi:MAG: hypothetical protein C0596_17225 [Marinilabiliales bacterium]|nr:MAG: hypothetical protein C0596_17225 [Marinilabiliales bacterium]